MAEEEEEEGQWSASPPTLHRWCLKPEQGEDVEEGEGKGRQKEEEEEKQQLLGIRKERTEGMENNGSEIWKLKSDMTSDGNDDESGLELCLGLSLGGNKSSKSKEKEREKESRFAVEDRDGFGGGLQDKDSHEEHGGGDKERDCGMEMEMVVPGKTRSLDRGSNSNSVQAGNNGEQKVGGGGAEGGGRMQAFWQQDFLRSVAAAPAPEKLVSSTSLPTWMVPSPPPDAAAAEVSRQSVENAVAEDSKSFARNIWHALQEKAAQPEHQRLPLTPQDEVSLIKELQGLPPHAVATAAAWARIAAQGAIPAQLLEAYKDGIDPMSQRVGIPNVVPAINSLSSGLNSEAGLPASVVAVPTQAAASVPPSNGNLARSDSDVTKNVLTMADQQQRQVAMFQQQQQQLLEQQRQHAETQKRQEARKKRKMLLEEQKQMKKAKKEDERPGLSGPFTASTNGKLPSGTLPNQLRRANSSQPPSPPLSSPPDSQDAAQSLSLTAFHRPGSGSWSHNWRETPVEVSVPSGPAVSSLTGKVEKLTGNEVGNQLLEIHRALQRERDRATKDRGADSESGATESADDPRKANVPDLTHPQKVKNEEGGASGKMGSSASVSAPLTAGKTIAGMTYPHNPAFPLMHVPYPFPIKVPAAAAAGGVPFSLPFPFPYVMQFAPATANGEGSQEPQINPNMPNPFQIGVPPVYSPFQIQPPEGPAAWTPAMLRPQLTPPHSPPTNGALSLMRTKSETPHEHESSQGKGSDRVKSRDTSPVQEQSTPGVQSLLRTGSLGSGSSNRMRTPPTTNPVPPAPQFGLARTKSDAADRPLRRETPNVSAFASVVDVSQGGAHIQGSWPLTNGSKGLVAPGGGTMIQLERTGSRVPEISADEAGTLGSGRPVTPGDSAQSGLTAARSASSIDEDKAFHHTGTWQQGSQPNLDALVGEEASSLRLGFAAGQQFGGTGSPPDLPWVTCSGNGPSGKTISGVLYRVEKGQVKIVCACHGSHMSPAEFVQHAGGAEMSNPEKAIVVGPFTIPTQTASAQA